MQIILILKNSHIWTKIKYLIKCQNEIHTSKDACNNNYECGNGSENCMTLSSVRQQQHKNALTSYATEIVVPTTNKRRYV